jgi:hypothetical protein
MNHLQQVLMFQEGAKFERMIKSNLFYSSSCEDKKKERL